MSSIIKVEYLGRVAVVTIDNAKKLNAMDMKAYYDLSKALREIATHDEVFITFLTAKGRYFSAGADVGALGASGNKPPSGDVDTYPDWLRNFVANNLNTTQAFYTHPKILVVGLNGPAVGLSAALTAFADFVYAVPEAFLLTPFSSLGLVAEGGASQALVQRLGISKANEALIMSKRISCEELVQVGYVNKVFPVAKGDSDAFRKLVLAEIDDRLGEHLIGSSLTGIKRLIRIPERELLDKQNVAEVFAGLDRFVNNIPQKEFFKIATGQKKHKL